jgi:ElaB/YqjD/DUF883 family membrane-anchored ribosome-binding protein
MASHTSNAENHARRSAKEIRTAGRRLRRAVAVERNGVMRTVQKVGNEAAQAVRDSYEGIRETAEDYVDQGRRKFKSAERNLERRIKQRPLEAVFIGIAMGFVTGFIYSRR